MSNGTRRLLDDPLVILVVLGSVNALISGIFWAQFGGNFAKFVGSEGGRGEIELGGAIAAYATLLIISYRIYRGINSLLYRRPKFKAFLMPSEQFARRDGYSCTLRIKDARNGDERKLILEPHREAGVLTLDLGALRDFESFTVELSLGQEKKWRSDSRAISAIHTEMYPYDT